MKMKKIARAWQRVADAGRAALSSVGLSGRADRAELTATTDSVIDVCKKLPRNLSANQLSNYRRDLQLMSIMKNLLENIQALSSDQNISYSQKH